MKVGDRVLYENDEGVEYVIEKEYDPPGGVFLIGNKEAFCDTVPAHLLHLAEDNQ